VRTVEDPATSDPYRGAHVKRFNELEELTPRVEALFVEQSKRYKPPSRDACRVFASALMVAKAQARPKDITSKPSKSARASAMALLRHLRPLRHRLEAFVADVEALGPEQASTLQEFYAERERLEAAIKAVETLLPALKRAPIVPTSGDPIRYMAQKAREAWADANNGHAPKSTNCGDPLVNVVAGALHLVGMKTITDWTVSAVLKDKRRRTKGGQKNS
jgi:hypothetical protein